MEAIQSVVEVVEFLVDRGGQHGAAHKVEEGGGHIQQNLKQGGTHLEESRGRGNIGDEEHCRREKGTSTHCQGEGETKP